MIFSILLPTASLKSASFSFLMINTTFSNPARFASKIEKSIMICPSLSTGSICFSPPYLLPIPAAIITRTGFFMIDSSISLSMLHFFYCMIKPHKNLYTILSFICTICIFSLHFRKIML